MMVNTRGRTYSVLMLALGGCASVKEVTVQPATICPGDTVSLSWRGSGVISVYQVPLAAGQPDQCIDTLIRGIAASSEQSEGTLRLPLRQNSVFYVEARGWMGKPAHRCARVFVNAALPLAALSQCAGPRRVRVVAFRPPGSQWSASARVGTVQNLNDVPVEVGHAGISEALGPGSVSEAFAELDDEGAWSVEYVLQDGPDCGQAGAKVPPSLSIRVSPVCAH